MEVRILKGLREKIMELHILKELARRVQHLQIGKKGLRERSCDKFAELHILKGLT